VAVNLFGRAYTINSDCFARVPGLAATRAVS
jgi:hypothetical protein